MSVVMPRGPLELDVRETFKLMMRSEVAPALRELGFKGSGVDYSLPHPTLLRMIHFQIDGGTEPDGLDFTVNVSLINASEYKERWEPWMPKRPTAAAILPLGRQFRIGSLLGDADRWWHITAGEPTVDQSHDVVRMISEYVVPELHRGSMRGPTLNRQPSPED